MVTLTSFCPSEPFHLLALTKLLAAGVVNNQLLTGMPQPQLNLTSLAPIPLTFCSWVSWRNIFRSLCILKDAYL